jgi:hypothetical protein
MWEWNFESISLAGGWLVCIYTLVIKDIDVRGSTCPFVEENDVYFFFLSALFKGYSFLLSGPIFEFLYWIP